MLYSAKKNIFIQSPYFAPDESFLDALKVAAHSGVDVRLMLPGIPDKQLVCAAGYGYARQALSEAGIRAYIYNGFLHAKTVVIDGRIASIGTTNIDSRSFDLNFEVNAFIYDQEFARLCEEAFMNDLRDCKELTLEWFASRSALTKAGYGLSRLMAPLL